MLTRNFVPFAWLAGCLFLMFLIPARVNSSDLVINASFDKKVLQIKPGETTSVNIILTSQIDDKISGATVSIMYPANILEYVESDKSQPNEECLRKNYKLNQNLSTNNDTKTGVINFTKVLIAPDEDLPSGEFCLATLTFKAKRSLWYIIPWFRRSGNLGFSDIENWQIVGPVINRTVLADADQDNVVITVSK